jgi:hypothetical protein
MRLHTDTLTEQDIHFACCSAGVTAEVFTRHGSRSRDHAFEVILSGSNTRNANGHSFKAATWDEWGVFFAALFERDPQMFAGNKNWGYDGAHAFHRKTDDRFLYSNPDRRFPEDTHTQHKWWATGDGQSQYCRKCTAIFRWK